MGKNVHSLILSKILSYIKVLICRCLWAGDFKLA